MNVGTAMAASIKRQPAPGTAGGYTTVISNLTIRTFRGMPLLSVDSREVPDTLSVGNDSLYHVKADWLSTWKTIVPITPKDILVLPSGGTIVASAADTSTVTVRSGDGTLFQPATSVAVFTTGTSLIADVSGNTLSLATPLASLPAVGSAVTHTLEYSIREVRPFPGSHITLLVGVEFL